MRVDELIQSPGQSTTRMQGTNNAAQTAPQPNNVPNAGTNTPQPQTEPKVPMGDDPQTLNQRKRQIDLQIKTLQDTIKNNQEQLKNLQQQKMNLK